MKTLRLLLVDDDEDDFWLTSDYLRDIQNQRFEIDWAGNYKQAVQKIQEGNYDICLSDFLLGAKTGLDLLQEANRLGSEVPIVLLTGKGDRHIDEEAMRLGAVDYLIKSELDAEKLERCIRYALDRRITLRALKESERRYRTLFEQSKDVVLVSDNSGKLLYFNASATELTEYSIDELQTLDVRQLFDNQEEWDDFAQNLEATGDVRDLEIVLLTKTGERKNCIVAVSHLPDGQYQGIVHDITNRKKAEQEQLRAEKLAATGRLVRALAHEVRNPLTNINLSAEQLEAEISDESLQPYIGIIRRNVSRINDLITELLNSARPAEMSLEHVWINQLLDNTLQLVKDRFQLKNIQVERRFEPNDCLLALDESKIQLAFLNFIINAVEAMESEPRQLVISSFTTKEKCFVTITDSGRGIPPEYLGRLFEPYFTSKSNGMGLGLAATLNILQAHRATVEVISQVGVGTTFTVGFLLLDA